VTHARNDDDGDANVRPLEASTQMETYPRKEESKKEKTVIKGRILI